MTAAAPAPETSKKCSGQLPRRQSLYSRPDPRAGRSHSTPSRSRFGVNHASDYGISGFLEMDHCSASGSESESLTFQFQRGAPMQCDSFSAIPI
eukprot:748707-Rhodomonas_salina.1